MSFSGQYTPLHLNAIGGLLANNGIKANVAASTQHGTWTPSIDPVLQPAGVYTFGELVTATVLSDVTLAIVAAYDAGMSDTTLAAINSIGANSIPALGNAPPSTFLPTHPGSTDPFPPMDYPNTVDPLSYVTDWNRPSPDGVLPETLNEYTITSTPSTVLTPYFKYGFLGCIARQAYYEVFTDTDNPTLSFIKSWNLYTGFKESQNHVIGSLTNTKSFLMGNYSNMNDLITSDLAGVTTDFSLFGQDCINLGKTLNLANAYRWNTPSVLLKTLHRYNCVSSAINFALLTLGLSINEITSITDGVYEATVAQEQIIYQAFEFIKEDDLEEVLTATNCQTEGLRTLADLLDPRYQFPLSYRTLTVPKYNASALSLKNYDSIYVNDGVNSNIEFRGGYLDGIMSEELATANGAFMMAIMQVKDVLGMEPEAFAQVIGHLERVDDDATLLNNTTSMPGDQQLADVGLTQTAFGSGPGNTYTYRDFYGAAAGIPYMKYYTLMRPLIDRLTTGTLRTIYASLLSAASGGDEAGVLAAIAAANTELDRIKTMDSVGSTKLNNYWSAMGTHMTAEQRATVFCVPSPFTFVTDLNRFDIYAWVRDIERFGQDTEHHGAVEVIRSLCDTSGRTGQSIVAAMKEARNAARLGLIGGSLYNDVPSQVTGSVGPVTGSINDPLPVFAPSQASASLTLTPSLAIQNIKGGSGYDPCQPPRVMILPIPGSTVKAQFEAVIDENTGSITDIVINNSDAIKGYPDGVQPYLYIDPPPVSSRSGESPIPGSLAGSPYTKLVPENLVTGATKQ